MFEIETLLT